MKNKNKRVTYAALATVAAALFCTVVPKPAYALGAASRACRFDSLPPGTKNVSAAFFYAVGAPLSVVSIPSSSAQNQANHWILESLTTDYFQNRYLLFAKRYLYTLTGEYPAELRRTYAFESVLQSTWTSQQISDAMKADPRFSQYYLNRGFWHSVRAGHPDIVEHRPNKSLNFYLVIGVHWYREAGVEYRIGDTQAENCNLTNWGLGLWDR
jgi:hypothetical protein